MKKTIIIKIIAIIVIMLLIFCFSSHVSNAAISVNDMIRKIKGKSSYYDSDLDKTSDILGKVLEAVRNIAVIATVIVITVLGVKYMLGSAEERAGYKKSMIPLAIGAIIISSAASIIKALYSMFINSTF